MTQKTFLGANFCREVSKSRENEMLEEWLGYSGAQLHTTYINNKPKINRIIQDLCHGRKQSEDEVQIERLGRYYTARGKENYDCLKARG